MDTAYNPTPEKISPKNVFLNLLAIATLYISAGSFIALLYQHINYYFPETLPYFSSSYASPLRWAMASLIIIFPVHIIISWLLQKEFSSSPEERHRRLRKWLVYLTLFLAAIAIIADLVTLVFSFLQGELSIRFILKVLAVLFVAGGVFWYYLAEIRRTGVSLTQPMKIFGWGAVAIVAVGVVSGFFVAGSPFEERLRRFDEQRVSDLQSIQYQIIEYWKAKRVLPSNIENLRNELIGFVPPVDPEPETGSGYEYTILGPLKFELCAEFKTDSASAPDATRPVVYNEKTSVLNDVWTHGPSRTCFLRTIDPDFYKNDKSTSKPVPSFIPAELM
ncbi:MAG: hypothetical protein A3C11_02240 [Candidatus Sungbacteria bacterium RIFCSPHIGHO2_02_FULL_49_12]|uniref:DUF5671 domain-containing protein n=1 Tax=Candidatus Sungbacteria bacterium RIFCSPHIGHO2_02_FULL_49_12 TaxID=1802271 RepID=A0A1G2KLZ5_9BACT|nr:MAG: hypothetical protein A3C11_02240 [Candidatus Sungbacteria bacterium RIFCSPHIGHO2_02_FULL_49_12]